MIPIPRIARPSGPAHDPGISKGLPDATAAATPGATAANAGTFAKTPLASQNQYPVMPKSRPDQIKNRRPGESTSQPRTIHTPNARVVLMRKPASPVTTPSKRSGFITFLDYS